MTDPIQLPPTNVPVTPDVLRDVFGDGTDTVSWSDRLDQGVAGATVGVWRASVSSRDHTRNSAILKVVSAVDNGHSRWAPSDRRDDPMYWRREADLYEFGWFDELPSSIRPPRLYREDTLADGAIAMWMEDLQGVPGEQWSLAEYERAALLLGAAQATLAEEAYRPIPELSRGWLRTYVGKREIDEELLLSDDAQTKALLDPMVDPETRRSYVDMWHKRDQYLAVLDALPKTACHLDFWPPNLFLESSDSLAMIDWAYAGIGTVGEDIGNLLPDSVDDGFFPYERAHDLTEAVSAGYIDGWRSVDAGMDPRVLRLGFLMSAVTKYTWVAPWVLRETARPSFEHDAEWDALVPARCTMASEIVRYAREGEQLTQSLGLAIPVSTRQQRNADRGGSGGLRSL